jgi:HTH-type transcriptional regulator/antitoxin HigA
MEQLGLNRSDLPRFIPNKIKDSEVLGRRRPLSLAMIRSLQSGLRIPAAVLLQKPRLRKARAVA